MRITKIGHSCLMVEEGGLTILLDPGNYNPVPDTTGIGALLITHEHDDHCYVPALQRVMERNPRLEIITHGAVGKKLALAGIAWTSIADGECLERRGVSIASYGSEHARVHPDLPIFRNTGFMIAERLFYPGDAFFVPPVPVEVLALPTAAPWMRLEESIEYAKAVKPTMVFPVHDGMLRPECRGASTTLPQKLLAPQGIEFRDAVEGTVLDV